MKSLFVIPVLAILLLATGCTALGTNGNATKAVVNDNTVLAETQEGAALLPATAEPKVVLVPSNARIDASSFLNALVLSGCEIEKAEYKEVTRGGGIIVTCTQRIGVLDAGGLEGL